MVWLSGMSLGTNLLSAADAPGVTSRPHSANSAGPEYNPPLDQLRFPAEFLAAREHPDKTTTAYQGLNVREHTDPCGCGDAGTVQWKHHHAGPWPGFLTISGMATHPLNAVNRGVYISNRTVPIRYPLFYCEEQMPRKAVQFRGG